MAAWGAGERNGRTRRELIALAIDSTSVTGTRRLSPRLRTDGSRTHFDRTGTSYIGRALNPSVPYAPAGSISKIKLCAELEETRLQHRRRHQPVPVRDERGVVSQDRIRVQ